MRKQELDKIISRDANKIIAKLEPSTRNKLETCRFSMGGKRISLVYEGNLAKAMPIIRHALSKCTKLLKPKRDITIIITNTTDDFITKKMGGVGGFTCNLSLIHLQINTRARAWRNMLFSVISHEFNHTVRFAIFNQETNLRGTMASEGLAQCFESEMSGRIPPWAKAISESRAKTVWKEIIPNLSNRGWRIYIQVFFGGNRFPKWSGYTISYLMVKKRLKDLKVDWSEAMRLRSEELIGSFD